MVSRTRGHYSVALIVSDMRIFWDFAVRGLGYVGISGCRDLYISDSHFRDLDMEAPIQRSSKLLYYS